MCFISHMVSLPFILHLNLMLAACPRNFNPHPDEFKTQHEFSFVYKQPDLQSFLGTPLLLQGLLSGYPRGISPCKSHLLAQGCRWVPMSPQGRMQHSCSFSVTGWLWKPLTLSTMPWELLRTPVPAAPGGVMWPPRHPLQSVRENCAAGPLGQNSRAVSSAAVWLRSLLKKGAMT